jgi:hypothetical protein
MKNLFWSLCVVVGLAFPAYNTFAAEDTAGKGEIKEVCHPKKDKNGKEVKDKNGKVVEECKKIKVRKKLEGTDIPPAKK